MIKIAINTRPLVSAHSSRGIGVYAKGLLTSLKTLKELELVEFTNIDLIKNVDLVHYLTFDLFFHTLPIKKRAKTLVTIHDLIPLLFPKHYPMGIRGYINLNLQKIALKNVLAIVTDSISSKKDISEILNLSLEKIHVVYPGIDERYKKIDNLATLDDLKAKLSLPDKFVLFGGNINWNKNLNNAIEACLMADIDVVLRGANFKSSSSLDHPEMESFKIFLLKFSNHPKVHNLGYVDEVDLVKLYNMASLTLLPSLAEGFGFPIVESQRCGTPVITSNISAMPEIAGKGAILVDPYSVSKISNAIKDIVSNNSLKVKLIKEGFLNAERFSWEKTAKQMMQLYTKIIEESLK